MSLAGDIFDYLQYSPWSTAIQIGRALDYDDNCARMALSRLYIDGVLIRRLIKVQSKRGQSRAYEYAVKSGAERPGGVRVDGAATDRLRQGDAAPLSQAWKMPVEIPALHASCKVRKLGG